MALAAAGGGAIATRATQDHTVAVKLVAERVQELESRRRGRELGLAEPTALGPYIQHHLRAKAEGTNSTGWIAATQTFLERAVDYFGAGTDIGRIGVREVQGWMTALQQMTTDRVAVAREAERDADEDEDRDEDRDAERHVARQHPTPQTIRHHLNALSNLYRRAAAEGVVPPGYNPGAALLDKPRGTAQEAEWLEVPDGALLLEAARTLPTVWSPAGPAVGHELAYPLVATFLLTGARSAEVLGLELADVSFDRQTVTIRPHAHRRLKTPGAARVIPLWPQLEQILRPYVFDLHRPPARLLFPAWVQGDEQMWTDIRKLLDRVAGRAGWQPGEIRTKMFRHTYCAARLQTLDHGAPVSPYVVSRELGHGSRDMVERVYSHLGTVRHRAPVVEYRVEQHQAQLADRLRKMGALAVAK